MGYDDEKDEERRREYFEYKEQQERKGHTPDPDKDFELDASVRVRLNEVTKKKWEAYINNTEGVNSLSELVRVSVAKEISENHTGDEKQAELLFDLFDELETKVEEEARKTRSEIVSEDLIQNTIDQVQKDG
jgi:hypothetical protein